jgi:hypothetical protein
MKSFQCGAVLIALLAMTGCDPTMENRVPSASEIEDGRDSRMEQIDGMTHLSEEQRQRMKDNLGGPAKTGDSGGRGGEGQ